MCLVTKISDSQINSLYKYLNNFFGNLNWWPGDSLEEIVIGAILTQNTNWKNVEKALFNLKKDNLLNFKSIIDANDSNISTAIRPSGFFNQKTERLKAISSFFIDSGFPNINYIDNEFRKKLLFIKGIGPETADSILLYAFNRPFFVVDAYTRRIFKRHGVLKGDEKYSDIANYFVKHFKKDIFVYNQMHAMIVEIAKRWCKKSNPLCDLCPVSKFS